VEEHLAACVNIASVSSCYIWKAKLNLDPRPARECFEMMRKRIAEIHSYAVPEIINLPIAKGHPNCHGTFVMGIDSEEEIGRLRENEKKKIKGSLKNPLASVRYLRNSIQCRYAAKDPCVCLQKWGVLDC
jgi:hypothetical protein